MKAVSCTATLCFLTTLTASANAAIFTWRVEDGGNGHSYELVGNYEDPNQRWNWESSKVMAESLEFLGMKGHLVTIGSAAENQFLIDTFHNNSPLPTWIGLTDNEAFGGFESFGQPNPQTDGWVWVTGEAVTFTDWVPGGPDGSFNREEDYALMGSQHRDHHMWNDEQSGTGGDAQFFVEYEPAVVPEPTSLGLWCSFSLAAVVWRLRRRVATQYPRHVSHCHLNAATLAFVTSLALALPTWCPAEDGKPLADQVAAVKQSHAELEEWFYAELRAAKRDNQKVSDANKKYRAGKLKHVAALQPLIDENPTDSAAFEAALVLVGDMSYPLSDEQAQIVLDHHVAHPAMGKFCFDLQHREGEAWARRILEAAAATHPDRSIRGQATYSLGDYYRLEARPFGDPPPMDVALRLLEKAKGYYQLTVKEFDDVSTPDGKWNLGKRSEHELARLRNLANLQMGRPAPPIAGTDLEGKPLKLEDYRGKVVVVVFWGSWCGPCMAKVPHERELVARLKDKPFALLGVSCGDTLELARETVKKHEMTWPSWYDGDETRSGPIQTDYDIQHWPSVFVIDAAGVIQAIDVHGPELDAAVDKALAKLP